MGSLVTDFLETAYRLTITTGVGLGGILGCCAAIDRIASDTFKDEIATRLTGHTNRMHGVSTSVIVKWFIDSTIGNYFKEPIFSALNVWKSIKLTFSALLLIVPLTLLLNRISPSVLWIDGDPIFSPVVILAFMIVSCFVIDIISYLQTVMFMKFASAANKMLDML